MTRRLGLMSTTAPPAGRPWLRPALGAAGYAAILALAWRAIDHQRFLDGVARLRVEHLGAVLAVALLHIAGRAFRFHCLLSRARPNATYRWSDGVSIFLAGLSMSAVTPARAGDLIKARLVKPFGIGLSAGVGLVVIERILDVVVMASTIVTMGLFLSERSGSSGWSHAALVLLVGLLAGIVILTVHRARSVAVDAMIRFARRARPSADVARLAPFVRDLFGVWDSIFASPIVFLRYFVLSASVWAVEFFKLWLVLALLDAPIPITEAFFVYPVTILAGVLSIVPFSEGVVGVTGVALLAALASVDPGVATVAMVLDRCASSLPPLALWGIFTLLQRTPRPIASDEAPDAPVASTENPS